MSEIADGRAGFAASTAGSPASVNTLLRKDARPEIVHLRQMPCQVGGRPVRTRRAAGGGIGRRKHVGEAPRLGIDDGDAVHHLSMPAGRQRGGSGFAGDSPLIARRVGGFGAGGGLSMRRLGCSAVWSGGRAAMPAGGCVRTRGGTASLGRSEAGMRVSGTSGSGGVNGIGSSTTAGGSGVTARGGGASYVGVGIGGSADGGTGAAVVDVGVADGGAGIGLLGVAVGVAVADLESFTSTGTTVTLFCCCIHTKLSPSEAMRVAASKPTAISTRRRRAPPRRPPVAGSRWLRRSRSRQKTRPRAQAFRAGSVWSTGSARSRSVCVRAAMPVQG